MDNNQARKQYKERLMEQDEKRLLSVSALEFEQHNNPAVYKPHIPTGYEQLDKLLGGGLTPGVHYIGAISSLGKSTYSLQMADYMAAHGQKVVYVSLEMRKIDLTAKLVSRYTYLEDVTRAKSAHQLTTREEAANFTNADWALIEKCAKMVGANGKNITILESLDRPASIDTIELYMEAYCEKYGVAPVLFVDYLQILAPSKSMARCTDKQAVDYTVAKFRQLASKYNTPVVVISSFNRASYDTAASMQDFKESGNIEYSADTLLALQLAGVGSQSFDVNQAKSRYPRKVELVVLKQRYGRTGDKIEYDFRTTYNHFEEVGTASSTTPGNAKPINPLLGK